MRKLIVFFSAFVFLTNCDIKSSDKPYNRTAFREDINYQPVWSDEFNYSGLPDYVRIYQKVD